MLLKAFAPDEDLYVGWKKRQWPYHQLNWVDDDYNYTTANLTFRGWPPARDIWPAADNDRGCRATDAVAYPRHNRVNEVVEYPGTFSDCQGNPYCEECIRPVIRRMHG